MIAGMAGGQDGKVLGIGFIQKYAGRRMVAGFHRAATKDAPALVTIVAGVG